VNLGGIQVNQLVPVRFRPDVSITKEERTLHITNPYFLIPQKKTVLVHPLNGSQDVEKNAVWEFGFSESSSPPRVEEILVNDK